MFFSCTSQNFLEKSKVSMAGKSLRVFLPVLRPGTCSENFHKTNENSYHISETFECLVDNLPGQHLSPGKLARGNYDVEGHIDVRIAESEVCDKLSRICFESSHQIHFLSAEIASLSMIVSLPIQKKEQIISQCQDLLNQSDVSLRQMAQLIDRLSSTAIAVLPAHFQYRSLQRQ